MIYQVFKEQTSHKQEVHGTATQKLRNTGEATTPLDSLRTSSSTTPHSTHSHPPATSRMASSQTEDLRNTLSATPTHIAEECYVGVAGDPSDYQEIRADDREPARTEKERQEEELK